MATLTSILGTDLISASRAVINNNYQNLNVDKIEANSPALTGTPTAPTAAYQTATTQLATTNFVQQAISSVSGVSGIAVLLNDVAIGSVEGAVLSATIPVGELNVGSTYEIYGYYFKNGTSDSTTPFSFIRIGQSSLTGTAVASVVGIGVSSGGHRYLVRAEVTIRSLGASGSAMASMFMFDSNNNNIKSYSGQVPVNIDTTVTNLIELTFKPNTDNNLYTFYVASIRKIK
jgi:hypothetical protein